MRIKLRLYARDLDLVSLKQMPEFHFGAAIRQALFEYVTCGECNRIRVSFDRNRPVVLKNDQVDISLNKEKYQPVVDWILSIRPGMRNAAIKAVFRSAIATPVLFSFYNDSALILPEIPDDGRNSTKPIPTENKKAVVESVDSQNATSHISNSEIQSRQKENNIEDDEAVLFDDDWIENY